MGNTLLSDSELPDFGALLAADIVPAIQQLVTENRHAIDELLAAGCLSLGDLVIPLEELNHRLQSIWSPVSHLQMVESDPDWRDAHAEALKLITEYATELSQNERLYTAFLALQSGLGEDAPPEHKSLIEHTLRNFRKAGVGLSGEHKTRFRAIMGELASANTRFSQNLQDATDAWTHRVDDEQHLNGLPETIVGRARRNASDAGRTGWVLKLDQPTYQAVMTHAGDENLRRVFYEAWVTRASDQGPNAGEFDNTELMGQILELRHEAASLVGFDNYAEYALDGRMARSVDEVIRFLEDLAAKSLPAAREEVAQLEQFARRALNAWDVAYYAEQLRDALFQISDARLRPYLPVDKVIAGLFRLASELYGLSVRKRSGVAVWHDSVAFYDVLDATGVRRGGFYADLYARDGKRSGAWIDECVVRKSIGTEAVLPVGYLVCNFSPAGGEESDASAPALLTHDEVVTLFHEFGHMLHHLLTTVAYPSIAGINGVPWDAVELPSQFMENFAWEREVLNLISGHHQTGEPLLDTLFEQLNASRKFNAGLAMLRQLEFALFDFRLHAEYTAGDRMAVQRTLADTREKVSLVPVPEWNRFANGFAHIFAGGYAAGYYSYKWAEVLAADAFSAFDMSGGLDTSMATKFRESILEVGGSRDILDAFVEFRGRKPQLDALLDMSGILH